MKGCKKAIYVLVHCPPVGSDPRMEWDVVPWLGHPAMAPHASGRQKVSTAAGDVELRVPLIVERNYEILGWAYHRVEQLHPKPGEIPAIDTLTDQELLTETLKLSLEYIALAERGMATMPVPGIWLADCGRSTNTLLNAKPVGIKSC